MNRAGRCHSDIADLCFLLAWLDPDREQAGTRYEHLRRKLTLFFEARRCSPRAEELADRTLDNVARRLQEGVEIYASEASRYCYGVVQNAAGEFTKASVGSVTAAAAEAAKQMPTDFRVSITNASGKGAPMREPMVDAFAMLLRVIPPFVEFGRH